MNITEEAEPPELHSPTSPASIRRDADPVDGELNVLGVQSPLHANQLAPRFMSPSAINNRYPNRSKRSPRQSNVA
jgi:hypothetical protein